MRIKLIILLFISFQFFCFSQDFNSPFPFSIYSFEEAGNIFRLSDSLNQLEAQQNVNKEYVNYLIDNGLNDPSFIGLVVQAFLRETENESIQEIVKEYIKDESKPLYASILYRYESYKEAVENSEQTTYRMNYNDHLYDENIEFHDFQEVSAFDDKLVTYIPISDWQTMQWANIETDEIENNNSFGLLTGGGTTACNITIKKEKIVKEFDKGYFHQPSRNSYEITDFGVISKNNADLTTLIIRSSDKRMFTFELRLFDYENMVAYRLTYFYNISNININFEIFESLKRHLLYLSFLTYIEK